MRACVFRGWAGLVFSAGLLLAEDPPAPRNGSNGSRRPERVWSMTLDARLAPAFQLALGGVFDPGPSLQTQWSHSLNNLFRADDKLTITATKALSLPAGYINWFAGAFYEHRLGRTGLWHWDLGGGIERWRFPSVLRGTQDWAAAWSLATSRPGRRVNWTAMAEGRNNFVSNVPRGALVVATVTATHSLWHGGEYRIALQHGPMYAHAWNVYGLRGPRVFRYSASLTWSAPSWSLEAGIRPQAGLSVGVRHYHYWSFGFSYHHSQRLGRSRSP